MKLRNAFPCTMTCHAWLTAAQFASLVSCMQLGVAYAQNTAASESLFQRGVASMLQGDYATACPSLAESQALEPRAGTKFTLAECEAKWGHVATAAAHYSDYLGMVETMDPDQQHRHADRAAIARKQIDALRPRIPTLILNLPAAAPEGTLVTRDGVALSRVSLGVEIPIDPGKHRLVTQVPSGTKRETSFEISAGEHKTLELELAAPRPTLRPRATLAPAQERGRDNGGKGVSHTWSYVAGGIGMGGITLGVVTGILSLQQKKVTDDNCVAAACNETGLRAAESGRNLATASTVGFGVGLAGAVAGVALWFVTPRTQHSARGQRRWSPLIAGDGRSSAVLGLRGTW